MFIVKVRSELLTMKISENNLFSKQKIFASPAAAGCDGREYFCLFFFFCFFAASAPSKRTSPVSGTTRTCGINLFPFARRVDHLLLDLRKGAITWVVELLALHLRLSGPPASRTTSRLQRLNVYFLTESISNGA